MELIIRNAVSDDCERIRPLQKEIAQLHHCGRPDLFRTEPRYFTQADFDARLADPQHTVLIAEDGNKMVGYVFAWVQKIRNHPTYHDFDVFYIDDICVEKAHHRKGIGRMLFEVCKEKANKLKCQRIELGVYAFNENAIAFYKSMGMTERMIRMECRLEEEQ